MMNNWKQWRAGMSWRGIVLLAVGMAACGGAGGGAGPAAPAPVAPGPAAAAELARPILYPLPVPPEWRRSLNRGTRTEAGVPGPSYWQQWVEYRIDARVDTEGRTLTGRQTVRYHNRSPDPLPLLVVNLTQNYHAEGVERVRPAEVTGGKAIRRVAVDGAELSPTANQHVAGWAEDGTLLYVVLPRPVQPGGSVDVEMDWSFPLPQAGAGGRMGYSGDNLLYLGYWYPQVAVYDDVFGWHAEPFRGNAEFYANFGRYEINIDAPAGWLVSSTGRLVNEAEVLVPEVVSRLRAAESGDEVVRVVEHGGGAQATRPGENGRLIWRFEADTVRDVAFAVMRDHAWDATRAEVADGHVRIDAFWRAGAIHYPEAAGYGRHAVEFLSRFTGLPYPWPHMTLVEGGGIIGGGMEYPMITILGDYNVAGPDALYAVTAHEIAHMWIPMMLSTNERRFAWLDEGTTVFAENFARMDRRPGENPFRQDQASYISVATQGLEGPIMRWSDFHYPGPAYGVASYPKPASVLYALKGVLGQETFMEAYREFHRRWAFRHPFPWDLWNTFEDVSGRDLGWFWRAWYHESTEEGGAWVLDQAIESVERLPGGETRVVVRDRGWIPMPVHLRATREDGSTAEVVIPVGSWLAGNDRAEAIVPAGARVTRVEIDPDRYFPDVDRRGHVWTGR
jgi:hypothetical protein